VEKAPHDKVSGYAPITIYINWNQLMTENIQCMWKRTVGDTSNYRHVSASRFRMAAVTRQCYQQLIN